MRIIPEINEPKRHNKLSGDGEYEPAMTFTQIANVLGTSRQNVFVIYSRALEKIRVELRRAPKQYVDLIQHEECFGRVIFPDWNAL
jgi:hypothetical protein